MPHPSGCICPRDRNDPYCPVHVSGTLARQVAKVSIGVMLAWEMDLNWSVFLGWQTHEPLSRLFWQHTHFSMWPFTDIDETPLWITMKQIAGSGAWLTEAMTELHHGLYAVVADEDGVWNR